MKTRNLILAGALLLCSAPAPARAQSYAVPRYRNPSMRTAGIVLTSLAIAELVAGVAVFGIYGSGGTGDGQGQLVGAIVGGPLVGASVLFAGAGIPLWVVGSRPPLGSAATALPDPVGAGRLALPAPRVTSFTFAF